jgi:hypothetical protein
MLYENAGDAEFQHILGDFGLKAEANWSWFPDDDISHSLHSD